MNDLLAAIVALAFVPAIWVYWREAGFQSRSAVAAGPSQWAAVTSAYVGIATSSASAFLRVYFILFGIDAMVRWGHTAGAGTLGSALLLAVLIAGGGFLIERLGRGYLNFVVDRRLRLNNASVSTFITDSAKGLLVSALFGLPLVAGWVWLMETGGPYWWLAAWALWFAVLTIRMLVKPHIETRLFAEAHELPAGELRSRLEGLLQRCGVKARSLRVLNVSARTNRVNASVTGLGSHKHILLYDTLVQRLNPQELEAVLAHEAGHVHHGHLAWSWTALGLLGLAGAYAISQAVRSHGLSPEQAVGLTLAVYPSALMCLRPLLVSASRTFEFQADAFAARHCGAGAIADALRKIFAANQGVFEHHWAYAAVFAGHPGGRERIERLQTAT